MPLKPKMEENFDLSYIPIKLMSMDNQTNSATSESIFQNGQPHLDERTVKSEFGIGFKGQENNDCEKCNFHEVECFDRNFGWLCAKCREWLNRLSN